MSVIGIRRPAPEGFMPRKALRIALVIGMLVLLSVAVNALTILADSNLRQNSATARDVSITAEQVGRLA